MKPKVLLPVLIFLAVFALYAATAAPGTLFGDPSEYQFIPAILGIAHPPGYAFYILVAKIWQLLVPVGTIAFRTNLLASAMGAWTVTAVYLITREIGLGGDWPDKGPAGKASTGSGSRSGVSMRFVSVTSVFAALAIGAASDLWQHAIHANAHVVSAALAATHLWFLTRWWRTGRDGWLAAFAGTLGLAATHHPIVLMGVPAYGLFILVVRPHIVREWRTLLIVAGCLLVGLTPLLYYPLRSPDAPFGPTDMNTWDGFIRHVTARGLRVNLFHFGLADQLDRALVFLSLLRLQFFLPVILLAPLGLVALARRAARPALLMGGFLLGHLAFTLNTVQDVMAYLLLPFAALAVLAGVGALALGHWARRAMSAGRLGVGPRHSILSPLGTETALEDSPGPHVRSEPDDLGTRVSGRGRPALLSLLLAILILPWPAVRAGQNLSRGISLRDFAAAEAWADAVFRRFREEGEGAALLAAWEYLTPLWVHIYTEGQELDEEDAELVYVSTASPWADTVWAHIEEQSVYIPDYRPSVRRAGFRLVPDGVFYRVERPPLTDATPSHRLDVWVDDRIHILGYDLPEATVRAGEPLTLVVYQTAPEPIDGIWMPYARLGPVEDRWTTDSRFLTTEWQPGEVVVERYEFLVPFSLPPGDYPLRLGYADLTGGRAELPLSPGDATVPIDTVTVLSRERGSSPGVLDRALANLDNQVALMAARVRGGGRSQRAFWDTPVVARAGGTLHLTLRWQALAAPRDSATVFIHLIDSVERPVAGWDYTPLGGSAPTYLWFPKWLPGQTFLDPYRLALPRDLPPGDYRLEVGMYGMTSQRRFPVVGVSGDLAGDRVILGPVRVE